jgi:hypothetical protein
LRTAISHPLTPRLAGLLVIGALCALFSRCASGPPRLAPVPEKIVSLDGYGSISVQGGDITAKSRFAFIFRPPDLGRVEALDMFGRTQAILVFREGKAVMILPSKGAYWAGPEEDLMDKFIGFGLSAGELSALISGRWDGRRVPAEAAGAGWSIETDRSGRAASGARGGFRFVTTEFFRDAPVPRTIAFNGPRGSGRLRVLKISFNSPARGDPFGLAVLSGLREKSWPEIEADLRDEH